MTSNGVLYVVSCRVLHRLNNRWAKKEKKEKKSASRRRAPWAQGGSLVEALHQPLCSIRCSAPLLPTATSRIRLSPHLHLLGHSPYTSANFNHFFPTHHEMREPSDCFSANRRQLEPRFCLKRRAATRALPVKYANEASRSRTTNTPRV